MSDMTLIPASGGFGGEAGAAGLGGAVGGLIGSWFGNGIGGWGGRGVGAVAGVGGAEAAVSIAGTAANMLTTALVSDIESIQSSLGALGLNVVQGQGATNLAIANTGAMNLNAITQQNTQNLLASVQGFAGLNTSIANSTSSLASAIATSETNNLTRSFQAQLEAQKCCCETNLNIERQAEATRALMRDQFAQSQAVLIYDLKAQLTDARFQNSQLAQTAQLNCKINQVEQLVNFKLPTPPTPPTGCC